MKHELLAKRTISRREFLRVSGVITAGAVFAACAPGETDAPVEAPADAVADSSDAAAGEEVSRYKEAPMLAELVASGELPPVDERLPLNPLVLPVLEEIGTYGGDINSVGMRPPPLNGYNLGNFSGQTLVFYAWGLRGEVGEVVPNIAESFEINEDSSRFTIHLREGLKWSDGEPYTAVDASFFWDHVLQNEELRPAKPPVYQNSDGNLIEFNVLDDFTIEFIADTPKPWFMDRLASYWSGGDFCRHPEHYMKQFHPGFVTEEELDNLVSDGGFSTWNELFGHKVGPHNVEGQVMKPYMQAFIPTKVAPDTPPWIWERNPYFWAVDETGQQLPYIDRILHTQVSKEVMDLQALTGDLEYVWGLDFKLLPDFFDAEEQGKVRVVKFYFPGDTMLNVTFNQHTEDEAQRAIYQDIRFRKAVSHAINRDEISTLNYFGTVSPSQPMPPLGTPTRAATEHLATLYTEYDPDLANSLLDEIGLDKRDADGWRLRPDGEKLFINFVHYGWGDDTELVVDHLQQVGIHATNRLIDSRLYWERMQAIDWDALTIGGTPTHPYILTSRRAFVPVKDSAPFPLFGLWLDTNGAEGLEPTGKPMENQEKWLALQSETDPAMQLQLVTEIVTTAREELWVIGTTTMSPIIGVLDPTLKNLPDEVFMGWDNTMADVYRPETIFFDR
jgi:peptide/nickel transport system substrate-binding protein